MSERTTRVECTFEDLAGTWIEVPDRGWTLAKLDEINSTAYPPAQVVALVQRYVVACHLQVQPDPDAPVDAGPPPAGPITNPQDLTEAILRHHMDARMLNFLVGAIYEGARHTFTLAPFAVRIASAPSVPARTSPPS